MLGFLITVLVGLLVVLFLCWVIRQLELPANVTKVACAIICLIFLLWVLTQMGFGF